ncbi:MAG: AI-2E family transporter [Ardenticatenaceae bacterium]|nr:AI-2E family transporter [Anaerolineales bacterium]MCB8985522.1 AI-2E family transporter [Ardenticatenaceae bacterium]MCB8988708.1 AI-2E family transporter [Ardenticatenaceae bacterium]
MQRYTIPYIQPRRLILWTLGVTAVIVFFGLLIHFQLLLLLLLTAIIVSTAVRPGIVWLEKRGVPKSIGLLLLYILIALFAFSLLWYTLPMITEQGTTMRQSLAEGYAFLRQSLMRLPNILVRRLLIVLPEDLPRLVAAANNANNQNPDLALQQGRRLLTGLLQIVAIATLAFYWTLEGEHIKQAIFLLIPLPHRSDTRQLVNEIETKVSGYVLGQGLLCLIIGIMALVAYLLIGLPHALLLAVFAGLLEAVPILGPLLGAVPAFIIGLSTSPLMALWVVVATIIIQQTENSLLVPRVMTKTIGVRPLVTLLSLIAFGSLFGILGALIALPLAAIIQLLLDRFLLGRESLTENEPGRGPISVLLYETDQLLQDVRSQVRNKEGRPTADSDALEDELEAIAEDLKDFLGDKGAVET